MTGSDEGHWGHVYGTKAPTEVSWYQRQAKVSVELIAERGLAPNAPLLDAGAGASTLVDGLLARGHTDITLVDVTDAAFAATRERLGERSEVRYVVADVTQWVPSRKYSVWHDRAMFHFLTEGNLRAAYRRALSAALPVGGHAVIATFALDGPDRCSGLPVKRYSADSLAQEMGRGFRLVGSRNEGHTTPWGASQSFLYCVLERVED
jgi:hypothetical protein